MNNRLHLSALGLLLGVGSACGSSSTPPAAGDAAGGGGGDVPASGGSSTTSGGAPSAMGGAPAIGGTGPAASGGAPGMTAGGSGGEGAAGAPSTPMETSICRAPVPAATPGNACPGSMPTGLTLTEVQQGLDVPVYLTFAPGDSSRMFVVERAGTIRIIKDGDLLGEPFLDISDMVETAGSEQGFLGLAFDPNFDETSRFWVYFIEPQGQIPFSVLGSVRVSADNPDIADPTTFERLIEVRQPAANHNGGTILFGPDDCLYLGLGDGGESNDPWNNAQSLDDHLVDGELQSGLLGKMIRIDPAIYPQPAPGNMTGDGVNPHLWDYGLRNPYRFSFDSDTGDLYIGDVGQNFWEEVDVEPAGTGQFNYGWNVTEGLHCRGVEDASGGCSFDGFRLPVAEYLNPQGGNTSRAVLGGFVYRGSQVPQLVGRYLYADFETTQVWTFVYTGEGPNGAEICDHFEITDQLVVGEQLTSFGTDADGEIYILTGSGRVLRIDSL